MCWATWLIGVLVLAPLHVTGYYRALYDPTIPPFVYIPHTHGHTAPRAPASTFAMYYSGNTPPSAQGSIDYVLGLFDSWLVLSSQFPVRVNFTWANLTAELPGVLGYTTPVYTGSGRNQVAAAWVARNNRYLIGPPFEIMANFNSDVSWYFGTDGQLGAMQYDFATVFMHEMIHGLGFTTLLLPTGTETTPTRLVNYNQPASNISMFDVCLYENSTAMTQLSTWALTTSVANQQHLLFAESNNQLIFRPTSGSDISLFAPNPYMAGSSGVHLNPAVYPFGGVDALMLPGLFSGQAYHYPGTHVFDLLVSVGHVLKSAATTTPLPTLPSSANPTASPLPPITATVTSTLSTSSTTMSATSATVTSTQATLAATVNSVAAANTLIIATSGSLTLTATTSPSITSASALTLTGGRPSDKGHSQWSGTFIVTSGACSTASCCCPSGEAHVTQSGLSVVISVPVVGAKCATQGLASLSLSLHNSDDQGASVSFNGNEYLISIAEIPAVLTISCGSCSTTAQCNSGSCLHSLSAGVIAVPCTALAVFLLTLVVTL